MTEKEKDRAFLETAKYLLDKNAEEMDSKTRARLREGRYRAIQSLQSQKKAVSWQWPAAGMAVACAAALAFFFLMKDPGTKALVSNVEDIELLASSEPIEFYDDLEFYGWLAEQEGAG